MKGYFFALPRLVARLAGGEVRRAEWSGCEVYGVGVFVFGMGCLGLGHALWPFVRPGFWRVLVIVILPVVAWVAFLFLYYVNSLFARILRALGLYSATTNNPLQHVVIISLMTLLAVCLLRDPSGWLQLLGIFWLALVGSNLLALVVLKILHEP